MAFREAKHERDTNLKTFKAMKRELVARAEELSKPGCTEAFGPQEVATFFKQWARTLDQAVTQIESDQEEIDVLMNMYATSQKESGTWN